MRTGQSKAGPDSGPLREYARIERDIVIIGVSSRFEIWAAEVWEEYLSRMSAAYESIAEKLVSYGPSQQ